jgi:hypothetical protein
VSRAEIILAEKPKKAAEPRRNMRRNTPARAEEDARFDGRQTGGSKSGVSSQHTTSGPPSKGNKPSTQSSRPGGTEVSIDPSARPNPGDLERGKAFEGLPGQKDLDSRLTDREDPKSRVKETGEALLKDPRGGGGSGAVQPGDSRYGSKESMIGADATGSKGGPTGTTIAPSRYDDEGLHAVDGGKTAKDNEGNELGRIGTSIGSGGLRGPTADAMKQALDEQDGKSPGAGSAGGDAGSGSSGGNSGSKTAGPNDITEYHTSKDGRSTVWKYGDGRVEVRNNETGTTTTQYPDGTIVDKDKDGETTTTEPPSIPGGDNQGAPLPADLQKQIDADVAAARKQARVGGSRQPGGADPNHTDPAPDGDDATGSGAADETKAVPVKSGLIVNPGSPGASSSSARPSLDQDRVPHGSDPNETDPAPDEP